MGDTEPDKASVGPEGGNEIASLDEFQFGTFSAAQYVNRIFPDKESLSQLDPLIAKIKLKIRAIDGEILEAVRQQSVSGNQARQDLHVAKSTIVQLLQQIRDIQRKAQQSEEMVQEICRDIKKLDIAKTHLTSTITALRRLAMLINAVDQLQIAAERHEYAEAAHLLGAVQQLAAHFRSFVHIPRVAELRGRVTTLEKSLRAAAIREFDFASEEALSSPVLLDRLRACCQVINALGPSARDELVDNVCRREMGVYTQIFSTIGETARLERVVNRYKWLLRRMEARRELLSVFPESWQVPQLLSITFCSITKSQLGEILDLKAAELSGQVENLLKAVEATNIFEEELERRFKPKAAAGGHRLDTTADDRDTGMAIEAAKVREKYNEYNNNSRGLNNNNDQEEENAAAAAAVKSTFKGAISSVFAPHLYVYVAQVERELTWAMDQMIKTETWKPLSPELAVLKSSNELTEAISAEVRQCTTRVTRGATLIELAESFKRVYRGYAARIVARLPKTVSGASSAMPILGGSEWLVKLTEDDVELICLLVSTAEHCGELVQQLQSALVSRIEPASLGEAIDMTEEEEEFRSVISKCLTILLLGLESRLENALTAMSRHNWSVVELAGDQSDYVGTIAANLNMVGSRLADGMPASHFSFFCDKLLRSFAPRFCENVFRCRKISDAGCQQMRLDVEAVKGAMIALSKAGSTDQIWLQSFATAVNALFARPEAVLKVVGSPAVAMVDTFFELLPQGAPADFQRMAELKMLKKPELTAVLDQYNKRIGRPVLLVQPEGPAVQRSITGIGKEELAKFKQQLNPGSSMKETMSRFKGGFGSMKFGK